MFNMLPLFAMQTIYYANRRREREEKCKNCPYYIDEYNCEKDKTPRYDYNDCYYND